MVSTKESEKPNKETRQAARNSTRKEIKYCELLIVSSHGMEFDLQINRRSSPSHGEDRRFDLTVLTDYGVVPLSTSGR